MYAILDSNHDYQGDKLLILADNLNTPNGVAFLNEALFVAETHRIIRFDRIEHNLSAPPSPTVVTDSLPRESSHGWRYLRVGPDSLLYISIGAPCNGCLSEDGRFATIMRLKPDGTGWSTAARGVRNSVGFDWHPETRELWFTDNGRDFLGDNLPPDELNRVAAPGMHYGFPYCHGSGIPDPDFGADTNCLRFVSPAMPLGPHVAALGMVFYTGTQFPSEYQGRIFIAEHGSWNRSERIGYRVMVVTLSGDQAIRYDVFAEGWLNDNDVSGRPVDLLQMPDGSLLVSDDDAGAVYRISFSK